MTLVDEIRYLAAEIKREQFDEARRNEYIAACQRMVPLAEQAATLIESFRGTSGASFVEPPIQMKSVSTAKLAGTGRIKGADMGFSMDREFTLSPPWTPTGKSYTITSGASPKSKRRPLKRSKRRGA